MPYRKAPHQPQASAKHASDLTTRWAMIFLGALLACLCAGATCNNQDFRTQTLNFDLTQGEFLPVEISIPYRARHTVDFVITNTGSATMTGTILGTSETFDEDDLNANNDNIDPTDVGIPGLTDASLDNLLDASTDDVGVEGDAVDEDDPFGGFDFDFGSGDTGTNTNSQAINLDPGRSTTGRFAEDQLVNSIRVDLAFICESAACQGTIDYAVQIIQLECRTNEECNSDQRCSLDRGVCVARDGAGSGCAQATADHRDNGLPWELLLALAFGTLAMGRLRRRPHTICLTSPHAMVRGLMSLMVFCALVVGWSASASAQRATFNRPSAQTSFGLGFRRWTGILAEDTQTGVTVDWVQSLQYRYFGFQASIGTGFFLTDQEPPPLERGMQTYSLRLGPRFLLPWRTFRFYADLEYERLGVISNALVRKTGQALGFNALGGALGARALYGPVLIDVRGSYVQVMEFDAGLLGLSVHIGINGIF